MPYLFSQPDSSYKIIEIDKNIDAVLSKQFHCKYFNRMEGE